MSQLQAQKLRLAYTRSSHYGGSLPNVNQIGCGLAEFQVSGCWLVGCRGGEPALRGLPPLTRLSLLAEPPPLPSGFISEHSTPRAGGTGAARPPKNGVPTSPLPPPHILHRGAVQSGGQWVGLLGSSWWAKGLEVLSSPISRQLLYPVSLESAVWLFCQRWLLWQGAVPPVVVPAISSWC